SSVISGFRDQSAHRYHAYTLQHCCHDTSFTGQSSPGVNFARKVENWVGGKTYGAEFNAWQVNSLEPIPHGVASRGSKRMQTSNIPEREYLDTKPYAGPMIFPIGNKRLLSSRKSANITVREYLM